MARTVEQSPEPHGDPVAPAPDAPRGSPSLGYMPALDGVRAFAVLGVMAFHSGIPFLPAGFLGVDTFFVLSGFLITSLLLGEWGRRAAIGLGRFWARRARRLLPALLAVIVFVVLYAQYVVPPGTYSDLRADALSALFYSANWHFIAAGGNYFVQTGPASPLTHTWSLAIEEQFYLVWPLLVLLILRITRDLRVLLAVCVAGALASALEMGILYRSGTDLTRLYYGTDTHAQCLLVGAALATLLALAAGRRAARTNVETGGWRVESASGRRALAALGLLGVVATGLMWWRVTYTGPFLWRGGFLLAAIATAAVLTSVVCADRSWLAGALSLSPIRYLGRISYGLYLWHFPLFQWVDGAHTGLRGYALFGIRCGVTLAVATASFYAVERPIRHGDVLRRWRAWVATPIAVAGVAVVVVASTAGAAALGTTAPTPKTIPSMPAVSPPGPKTTVVLLGDSTALTFGFGLSMDAARYGAVLDTEAITECGVALVTLVQTEQSVEPPGIPCRPATPPDQQWPALWTASIEKFHPSVVAILVGRWEVSNVNWDGRWTSILSASFARYVAGQLQAAIDIASSQGARVALLTAPCFDSGEQPNGNAWPADSATRLDAYNRILGQVAAANASIATLVNLDAVVCPGGRFVSKLSNGTPVRSPDGVHFPWFTFAAPYAPDPDTVGQVRAFGAWIAPRIWPQILERG